MARKSNCWSQYDSLWLLNNYITILLLRITIWRGLNSLGIITNMRAELLAIYHGLRIALDFRDFRMELKSNLLEAQNLIKHGDTSTHEFGVIFEDIMHFLSCKASINISHILCETNNCVDLLAKIDSRDNTQLYILQKH